MVTSSWVLITDGVLPWTWKHPGGWGRGFWRRKQGETKIWKVGLGQGGCGNIIILFSDCNRNQVSLVEGNGSSCSADFLKWDSDQLRWEETADRVSRRRRHERPPVASPTTSLVWCTCLWQQAQIAEFGYGSSLRGKWWRWFKHGASVNIFIGNTSTDGFV